MDDHKSTRLERLQAAQDRLLRYAQFRLGEEMSKARLGVDAVPARPSRPGQWDLAFAADNADALGLMPNSFDSFAPASSPGALGSASGPGPQRRKQQQQQQQQHHATRTTLLRVTTEGSSISVSGGSRGSDSGDGSLHGGGLQRQQPPASASSSSSSSLLLLLLLLHPRGRGRRCAPSVSPGRRRDRVWR